MLADSMNVGTGQWLPGSSATARTPTVGVGTDHLVYACVASALPVWVLLQPRDYLSSFLLYAGVGGSLLAVIVGTDFRRLHRDRLAGHRGLVGHSTASGVRWPLRRTAVPALFITIACGTISGFHSLVSSGTTAKQLNQESDARLIGYGGMLGEGLLAPSHSHARRGRLR